MRLQKHKQQVRLCPFGLCAEIIVLSTEKPIREREPIKLLLRDLKLGKIYFVTF